MPRPLVAAALVAALVPAASHAEPLAPADTAQMVADCQILARYGAGAPLAGDDLVAAERCHRLMEGFFGAAMLITPDYYPLTAQLGYCPPPDATTADLAREVVAYADANPDCARLAHFAMCVNAALKAAFAGGC